MSKRHSAKYKLDRVMGENLWGRPKSPVNKRSYGPGQHGQRRKQKTSDFGLQLKAKQKLKGYYGNITEKQFLRTYDLFRRYTETHVEPYDVAYVPPDRFVEYNAADRKAIWTTTLNVVRQVAPTAPIVTETAGSPDDEAFAHEEPVPELQSPADRSVSRGDEHSRTETASSLAAQDVPHALPDDLPDDLPNLIDADPAIVRSIVAHAQSPRPTVQPRTSTNCPTTKWFAPISAPTSSMDLSSTRNSMTSAFNSTLALANCSRVGLATFLALALPMPSWTAT